jgi:hypothetical protein
LSEALATRRPEEIWLCVCWRFFWVSASAWSAVIADMLVRMLLILCMSLELPDYITGQSGFPPIRQSGFMPLGSASEAKSNLPFAID